MAKMSRSGAESGEKYSRSFSSAERKGRIGAGNGALEDHSDRLTDFFFRTRTLGGDEALHCLNETMALQQQLWISLLCQQETSSQSRALQVFASCQKGAWPRPASELLFRPEDAGRALQ